MGMYTYLLIMVIIIIIGEFPKKLPIAHKLSCTVYYNSL